MMLKRFRLGLAVVTAFCTVLVFAFYTTGAQEATGTAALLPTVESQSFYLTAPAASDALTPTNCRYGVAYSYKYASSVAWVPTLDAGWYINFGAQPTGQSVKSSSFAPVIRVRQDRTATGARLPTYRFEPPLAYTYLDNNGFPQIGLGTLISQNRGHYWIVGNEVDVNNNLQDNMMPDVYARAYHDAYQFIKQVDPTAKVAVAGLSMMTPGRLQYMTIVWDTYKSLYGHDMPVDIWNMHLYILEERVPGNPNEYGDGKIALGTDPALAKLTSFGQAQYCPAKGAADISANDPRPDVYCRSEHDSVRIFREQVIATRQWMKDRGQQNKPLIISEYGLLYPFLEGKPDGTCEFLQDEHQQCFNPIRVTTFMHNTMAFMENTTDPNLGYPADGNRLVQQWLWYSIITDVDASGGSSNLLVSNYTSFAPGDPGALTSMGQTFQQEAISHNGQSNLVGGLTNHLVTSIKQPGNTASAKLTASFRNSGTLSVVAPVTVTFFSDQALTKVIGSTIYYPELSGTIAGCTWDNRNSEHASIVWSNLPVGTYSYWAVIDSTNAVGETSESDNVTTRGTVTVLPNGLYVPVVRR